MARRTKTGTPEQLRQKLIDLLTDFEQHLSQGTLRQQVRELIPAHYLLRDLGGSLLPDADQSSARQRILRYLVQFHGEIVDGDELMVVAGISEYARRIRELRVQEGWPILSGDTARALRSSADTSSIDPDDLAPLMRPDQYLLQSEQRDREAADRWHQANQIRKLKLGVREKLLRFFLANIGKQISSEELRYIAGDKSEWARRTRELRTEDGWPVITRNSGDPSLAVGVYVMASDKQAPEHDRKISELVRREVMKRDQWSCQWRGCKWPDGYDVAHDHRFLEAHHINHHAKGGDNSAANLITLCNLHHDEVHRSGKLELS